MLMRLPTQDVRIEQTGHVIVQQAVHMTRIIDDLPDVSRVTRGLVAPKKQVLDSNHTHEHVLRRCVEILRRHHDYDAAVAEIQAVRPGTKKALQHAFAVETSYLFAVWNSHQPTV